jgi:hypothetical protein
MKSALFRRTFLVITALLISMLTCYGQDNPRDPVVGKWIKTMNGSSTSFDILSDNKWEVEFTGDDELEVWGSYAISGNKITFTDEGGQYSSSEPGVYEFKADEKSLIFTIVDDPVNGRSMLVTGTWTRAGDEE